MDREGGGQQDRDDEYKAGGTVRGLGHAAHQARHLRLPLPCPDCEIEEDGASHSRRGANYTDECRGETGAGAHTRICQHQAEIRGNVTTKSMASHLSGEHPEHRHS